MAYAAPSGRNDSRTRVANAERDREIRAKLAAPHGETSPQKAAQLRAIRDTVLGTSARAQERRLLAALEAGPVTSFEAMRLLDVYHCPARVLGLRKRGVEILTSWLRVSTEAGVAHRVGQYSLLRGSGQRLGTP